MLADSSDQNRSPIHAIVRKKGKEICLTRVLPMNKGLVSGKAYSPCSAGINSYVPGVMRARQRGWKAGVMPDFREGRFVPDAVVEKDGEKIYVEVELHYGKEAKWRNMHNALGYMAFCGRSPQHEETLREECGEVGESIYATNLTGLITGEEKLWE